LGFREAALTFLNGQAAFVADAGAGLRQMWEQVPETEEAASCEVAPGQGNS
jgi:hypothetical protein